MESQVSDNAEGSTKNVRNIQKEVIYIRMLLREKSYASNPLVAAEHKSLNGDRLDDRLIYFTDIVTKNFSKFIHSKLEKVDFTPEKIYVTKVEREEENISNLTKKNIEDKIYELSSQLESSALYIELYEKDVKNKAKSYYVDYYYQLLEILDST